jgi:ribosomal protein S18 acetylase RimI-like enzyme
MRLTAIHSHFATPFQNNNNHVPFIVEPLSSRPDAQTFQDIADMCITAFFNDDNQNNPSCNIKNNNKTAFWKEWQLRYLRRLQAGDLDRRRRRDADTNFMFVARKVERVNTASTVNGDYRNKKAQPLILDNRQIENLRNIGNNNSNEEEEANGGSDWNDPDYVRGEILGFVEVTQRPYGLGGSYSNTFPVVANRAVLTNLSVKAEARGMGVGSKLMQCCERAVRDVWNMDEIVLEVEDDNPVAEAFYRKRGYRVVFEDPTSRRYDTSGLFLRQVRCKRKIMRKVLNGNAQNDVKDAMTNFGMKALQRLRDSMFSVPY